MSGFLKQSTASQTRILGAFIDDTDFKTAETGLTIANTDIKLSANGGAAANKNSGGGTHIANGNYAITLDATDTATVGELEISCKVAGALQVFDKFFVVEEAVYDAFYAASAAGIPSIPASWITAAGIASSAIADTKIATGAITSAKFAADAITSTVVADNTITAAKIAADAITAAKIAADAIGASELAADAATEIGAAVWNAVQATHTTGGSFGELATEIAAILVDTGTTLDGKIDTVDTVVDAVKVKTDQLTFTVTNQVDSNIESVNTQEITGDGGSGTEFQGA